MMKRRDFLKGLLGIVGLAVVAPTKLFKTSAAGATPATAIKPIIEIAEPLKPITLTEYGRSVPYTPFQWVSDLPVDFGRKKGDIITIPRLKTLYHADY